MITGDLLSAFPHRQFHTLPGLLDSWAALPNANPNACMPMQGGNLYHFYDGLWYDPTERRTHDLPCERRTRYRLSQPDTLRPRRNQCALKRYLSLWCQGRIQADAIDANASVRKKMTDAFIGQIFTARNEKQHTYNAFE